MTKHNAKVELKEGYDPFGPYNVYDDFKNYLGYKKERESINEFVDKECQICKNVISFCPKGNKEGVKIDKDEGINELFIDFHRLREFRARAALGSERECPLCKSVFTAPKNWSINIDD